MVKQAKVLSKKNMKMLRERPGAAKYVRHFVRLMSELAEEHDGAVEFGPVEVKIWEILLKGDEKGKKHLKDEEKIRRSKEKERKKKEKRRARKKSEKERKSKKKNPFLMRKCFFPLIHRNSNWLGLDLRSAPPPLSYGYSNPMGYQTSDFRLLWTIPPNPQHPSPP